MFDVIYTASGYDAFAGMLLCRATYPV